MNGYQGKKFRHACGLRQGDPISPLLFVIMMDALTAMVIKAQEMGAISAMSGYSALQRLSIYVDDVILFIKPINVDLAFIREALQMFGTASGLHVNFAKSSAIMILSDETDKERVAGALPWQMEFFPCKYLSCNYPSNSSRARSGSLLSMRFSTSYPASKGV